MLNYYEEKLQRRLSMIEKLNVKSNDISFELTISEQIRLSVLEAEIRLLKEFIEDLKAEVK